MNNCGIGFADYFKNAIKAHYFKTVPVGHTTFIHYSLFTIQYSILAGKTFPASLGHYCPFVFWLVKYSTLKDRCK